MPSDVEMKYEEFPSQSPPHATPPAMMYYLATPPPPTPPVAMRFPDAFQQIISGDKTVLNLAEWGQNHPDHRQEALRVRWTAEEEIFVADFVGKYPTATLKECYSYVIKSLRAKNVFHPNHVCNHFRLEHAFKKVKKTRAIASFEV